MIKTMFLVIALVSFVLMLYFFGLAVGDTVTLITTIIISLMPNITLPIWSKVVMGLSIFCLIIAAILFTWHKIWGIVEQLTRESEEIERRAYYIWEQEGRPNGRSLEHWMKAMAEWEDECEKERKKRRWLWIKQIIN